MPLFPWQEESKKKIVSVLSTGDASVDGSDTGSGKTFSCLEAVRELGVVPLVVTPKSVVTSFKRVAEDLGVPVLSVCNIEKLKTGKTPYLRRGPVPKGSKKRSFEWLLPKGSLVIFDEAHVCSGLDSDNARILALTKAYGLKVHMMSATLAENPLKLRSVGYLLGLHEYRMHEFKKWCLERGCVVSPWGGSGALEFTSNKTRAQEAMAKIHNELLPFMTRLRIADLPDFPDNEVEAKLFDLNDRDTAEINQIYRDMDTEIRNPQTTNPLVVLLRARQRTELLKVPLLSDLTTDAIAEGRSVVLFVSFRETLDQLRSALKDLQPALIHGDQTAEERGVDIAKFQDNRTRVCICMSAAGGLGVSLDDVKGGFPRTSFITPNYSAVQMRQILGRIHRASSKSKAVQQIVLIAGTIEEDVQRSVQKKLGNLDLLNDGDLSGGIVV